MNRCELHSRAKCLIPSPEALFGKHITSITVALRTELQFKMFSQIKSAHSSLFLRLLQTTYRTPDRRCRGRAVDICTTCDGLLAGLAMPNTGALPLHCLLATKAARVLSMLCDLHLLNVFPQASSIASTILADNAHFLCTFCHFSR